MSNLKLKQYQSMIDSLQKLEAGLPFLQSLIKEERKVSISKLSNHDRRLAYHTLRRRFMKPDNFTIGELKVIFETVDKIVAKREDQ